MSIGFIDDRLKKLSESIDTISRNTIDFKSANNIYNPEIQTTKSLENITKGQEISFNFEMSFLIFFALGILVKIVKRLFLIKFKFKNL